MILQQVDNLGILPCLPLEQLAELRRVHLARHGHDSSADVAPTDVSTPKKVLTEAIALSTLPTQPMHRHCMLTYGFTSPQRAGGRWLESAVGRPEQPLPAFVVVVGQEGPGSDGDRRSQPRDASNWRGIDAAGRRTTPEGRSGARGHVGAGQRRGSASTGAGCFVAGLGCGVRRRRRRLGKEELRRGQVDGGGARRKVCTGRERMSSWMRERNGSWARPHGAEKRGE